MSSNKCFYFENKRELIRHIQNNMPDCYPSGMAEFMINNYVYHFHTRGYSVIVRSNPIFGILYL